MELTLEVILSPKSDQMNKILNLNSMSTVVHFWPFLATLNLSVLRRVTLISADFLLKMTGIARALK